MDKVLELLHLPSEKKEDKVTMPRSGKCFDG